jgi:hypothetical protein
MITIAAAAPEIARALWRVISGNPSAGYERNRRSQSYDESIEMHAEQGA